MKKLYLLIAILLCCPTLPGSSFPVHPESLESLDNASIFSIYQDGIGAIWLSTNYGLYRYNGNNIRQFHDELPQNALCGDGGDISFFAISRTSFLRYDIRKGEMQEFKIEGIGNPAASVLCSAGCDSLYIGYESSIRLYSGGKVNRLYNISGDSISSLCLIDNKNLLIGTKNGSIYLMDKNGSLNLKFRLNKEKIHTIFKDRRENIWIGTESAGTFCIDIKSGKTISHYKSGRQVRTICEDSVGNMYVGCLDGLFKIDKNGIIRKDTALSPSGHATCSLLCDRDDNIWIGTYYSGVFMSEAGGYPFDRIFIPADKEIRLINALVNCPNGNRYAFTDHYGIWKLSPSGEWSMLNGTKERKFKSAIYDKSRNCIWTGEHLEGLKKYEPSTGKWTSYGFENKSAVSVFYLTEKDGQLYIGTNCGLFIFDPDEEAAVRRSIEGISSLIFSLAFDYDGAIWIGSRGLFKYEEGKELECIDELKECRCCSIDIGKDGEILVATDGKGVWSLKNGQSKFINNSNAGLESNFTYLVKKVDDYILAGSRHGISIIDQSNGKCYNYKGANGLGLSSTKDGSLITEQDGTISICGTDGIVQLVEGKFKAPSRYSDFVFDDILINGRPFESETTLPFSKEIILDHKSTSISVEVAAFNFSGLSSERFQYRLSGINDSWYGFSLNQPLSWNNLKAGSYSLEVRMFSGNEIVKQKSLHFVIKPAWYTSTVAIILYITIILGIGIWLLTAIYTRMLLSEQLKAKEKENNERMRFFVNISHELRTPLTLIVGQLELFFRSHNQNDPDIDKIESTYRNAQKMQSIVSDLLDFEKQNQGYTFITVKNKDLRQFIIEQRAVFSQYANFRNIDLQISVPSHAISAFIDEYQMQKVFSNLLVNAFKFTPDGGKIKITLNTERYTKNHSSAVITVSDTGSGISKSALEMIFNPFFQDPASELAKRTQGSGIGLALCKGIIELHHGSINACNNKSGGAEFTINLPLGNTWMDGDEKVRISQSLEEYSSQPLIPELFEKRQHSSKIRYRMLIVEDDEDMREMISSIFSSSYDVIVASDGSEGFSLAKSHHPDIIISDVMMPVMNGLSLCAKLREEFETCHIPIILLTAHYSIRTSINGMDAGADAYISKPFNIDILDAKCRSLLENRELMRSKFCRSFTGIDTLTKSDRDSDLLTAVIEIIERNIQEPELHVGTLCKELNIGRTILAEKIKGITGMTPREFIESIKMKHAAQLLKNGNMRISEVAYELGFNDPKYFTLRFKKQFGQSPSEYSKQV